MNADLLQKVAYELDSDLSGAIVSKIFETDNRDLILKLFRGDGERSLLISTHPRSGSMHTTGTKYVNPDKPPRFCALLRSRIKNARIERIEAKKGERIAVITLKKLEGETERRYTLVIELTGKSSNIILVDSEGVVVDALKHFDREESSRVVAPGIVLADLPPPPGGLEEASVEKGELASFNSLAENIFKEQARKLDDELRRALLARSIREAKKRAARKLKNLNGDGKRARGFLEKKERGDLLLANFALLKRGMEEIEVDDYYKTPPEKITIPLDPKLGPQENIDKIFKRVRKGKRTLEMLEIRIPRVKAELLYIDGLALSLENAESIEELETLKEELSTSGYLKRGGRAQVATEKKRPDKEEKSSPVERLTTKTGTPMLLGKSGAGNDQLVTRHAAADDLWFHAKGVAGAHVLLRSTGRGKAHSDADIEEAARLAAINSKDAKNTRVEVIYTEARHVKKPKGAKPGMVRVDTFKAITVKT